MRRALLVAALVGTLAGCGASGEPAKGGAGSGGTSVTTAASAAATPVQVDTVRVGDLQEVVDAPGETRSLRQIRVRAPFTGRLATLSVADGDRVRAGESLAAVVSRNSEAALEGARSMLAEASSARDSADAERALQLAKQSLVRRMLTAPATGIVLSHAANAGDLVDEGETVLTLADRSSIVFIGQLAQRDVPRVSAGQKASVRLTAVSDPLPGKVHGVLPDASSTTLSAPLRIDFLSDRAPAATGLFGSVRIVVGVRKDATLVPAAAVLRDDVTGTTKIAVVADGRAVWKEVRTGLQHGDTVQILSPSLTPGTRLIVSGQVGLPDSSRVRIQP